MIHYRVMMEPNGTSIFFLAPQGKTLEGDYRSIAIDNGGAVFNFDSEHPVTVYEADSDIAVPAPSLLRESAADVPANFALTYLQLPALDIRISKLAEQITATQATSYDKAAEIERYLQTNYGYTLQLPRTVPRDPLAEFLFVRKRGHCEYFASAMAVMLRTLNIPSRVVNGFRTTEFNDLTGNYVIRASSAHSWVEAFFAIRMGGLSIRLRPLLPGSRRGTASVLRRAPGSFWREWVVNYDATHQRALGHDAVQNRPAPSLTLSGLGQPPLPAVNRFRTAVTQPDRAFARSLGARLFCRDTPVHLIAQRADDLAGDQSTRAAQVSRQGSAESRHALVRAHDPVDGQARMEEEPVRYAIKVSPTDRRSRATKQSPGIHGSVRAWPGLASRQKTPSLCRNFTIRLKTS